MTKQQMLLTGASGFIGATITNQLEEFEITSLGTKETNDVVSNLAVGTPPLQKSYDVVVHAAGLAHSRAATEQDYMNVNLHGTINLTQALDEAGVPKDFIFISSVAVYGLDEGELITEAYPLNATLPYGKSKALAEEFLQEWALANGATLTILRPSLIAGRNPKGNLGAMINGIKKTRYLSIGKANARKSVLMVDDIPNLIRLCLGKGGVFNVCDDHHPTFKELESIISKQLNNKLVVKSPYFFAKSLALVGDLLGGHFPIDSPRLDKIVKSLTFSNEKAKKELNWKPLDVLANFVIE